MHVKEETIMDVKKEEKTHSKDNEGDRKKETTQKAKGKEEPTEATVKKKKSDTLKEKTLKVNVKEKNSVWVKVKIEASFIDIKHEKKRKEQKRCG